MTDIITECLITSQGYRDPEIVAKHSANRNYSVLISPALTIDGDTYYVLLDGHHRFTAAMDDGVEPVYTIATEQDHDAVGLDAETFLEVVYMDTDYYYAATDKPVW